MHALIINASLENHLRQHILDHPPLVIPIGILGISVEIPRQSCSLHPRRGIEKHLPLRIGTGRGLVGRVAGIAMPQVVLIAWGRWCRLSYRERRQSLLEVEGRLWHPIQLYQ